MNNSKPNPLDEYDGSEKMIDNKTADKQLARSGRSRAARLLSGVVPAAVPVSSPQEPWRNKTPKGKNRGKKHK